MKGRGLLRDLCLLVAALSFCELALQGTARLLPRLGYLLKPPGARFRVSDPELGYRFSRFFPGQDASGYRNPNRPSRSRHVAVGDSYTYGYGVAPSQSWPRRLAAISGVEVYNGGIPGYGFCEYGIVARELLALKPEWLILATFPANDFSDSYRAVYAEGRCPELKSDDPEVLAGIRKAQRGGSLAERARALGWEETAPPWAPLGLTPLRVWLSERSSLYGLLRELRYRLSDSRPSSAQSGVQPHGLAWSVREELRTVFKSPELFTLTVNRDDPRIREGVEVVARSLDALRADLDARGIRLLVVIVPDKAAVYAPLVEALAPASLPESFFRYAEQEQSARAVMAELLVARGLRYVDTTDALRAALTRGLAVFPSSDDHHNSALGYEIIAHSVRAALSALTGRALTGTASTGNALAEEVASGTVASGGVPGGAAASGSVAR